MMKRIRLIELIVVDLICLRDKILERVVKRIRNSGKRGSIRSQRRKRRSMERS